MVKHGLPTGVDGVHAGQTGCGSLSLRLVLARSVRQSVRQPGRGEALGDLDACVVTAVVRRRDLRIVVADAET